MSTFLGRVAGQREVQDLLNAQADHLVRAAKILAEMVSADSATRPALNVQLHEVENDADTASHEVVKEVGSRFVLAYDRGDLIALSGAIDDCVDAIDEAGDNLVLYRIGSAPRKLYTIADIILECAEHAVAAVGHLRKLKPSIRAHWLEIHNLENRADALYRELIIDLFESDPSPKELIAAKIAFDSFEAAVDSFEQLANAIELLTIKES